MHSYEELSKEYDIIVVEGAGSPAEINLMEDDIVNMGLAKMLNAPVLLVGDIDRGGVFASLYGTVKLLEPEDQKRVKGLIINKFRGDIDILKPGIGMIEEKLGIGVLGTIPMKYIDIDDEDSLSSRLEENKNKAIKAIDIATIISTKEKALFLFVYILFLKFYKIFFKVFRIIRKIYSS